MTTRPFIPKDYKNLTSLPVKRNRYRVARSDSAFTRPAWLHNRVILAAIGAVGCLYVGASWIASSGTPAQASVRTHALDLPAPTASDGTSNGLIAPPSVLSSTTVGVKDTAAALNDDTWQTVTVKKGQTLGSIFANLGLSAAVVHQVVNTDDDTRKLTRIYPGDDLLFRLSQAGSLEALRYRLDETVTLRLDQTEDGYTSSLLEDQLVRNNVHASGVINDSLFLDAQRAGLSDSLIMELASLFGWDIDFVLDIRQGDAFHVVYEKIYRNGEYLRNGNILAATFVNQGEKYQAIRFERDNGVDYFSPDGRNMKKAFLRAPVNFSAVTSGFNPRRRHPVTKRVSAHRGVDYRAPVGAKVVSVGDGSVTRASYDKINGHHVFVRHPNGVVTKYLHFKKRAVKKGQRVKQGQVVGFLGGTGRVTGPHLHYEFVVNGVHRNPRTVKLPAAKPLPDSEMPAFEQACAPLLALLDNLEQTQTLAQLD